MESLKSFFDSWKGRHPMLLQIVSIVDYYFRQRLVEKYKTEGIIKKYDSNLRKFRMDPKKK